MPAILALLRPGDIVTHMYTVLPNGIFDGQGRVLPEVLAARRRGVLFDIGHGRLGRISWETATRGLAQRFPPDTITTDMSGPGLTDQVFDLPTVLSKFLLLGMPLDQVVACATSKAALAIGGLRSYGSLRTGAAADVAVFELKEGDFEFVDNLKEKRIGHQKLVPHAVVFGGKRVSPV
jgi:dihydroorotase